MRNSDSYPAKIRAFSNEHCMVIALTALAWTLRDDGRARRLLELTGLTAEDLRASAADPAILAALLDFLAGHEPDLVACAEAIGVGPADLIRARDSLGAGAPQA